MGMPSLYFAWCAFFAIHEEALDGVYIDSLMSQTEPCLVVGDAIQELFIAWMQESSGYTPKAIVEAYCRYPPLPSWFSVERQIAGIPLPLPFTQHNCPSALTYLYTMPRGWVYILGMSESPFLKIGHCLTTPARRVAELQTGTPHRLSILASYPHHQEVAPNIERAMHGLLWRQRQGRSEWFAVDLETAQIAHETVFQDLILGRTYNGDPWAAA